MRAGYATTGRCDHPPHTPTHLDTAAHAAHIPHTRLHLCTAPPPPPPRQAAFHSLYFALREGRCPYFYLRCGAAHARPRPYPYPYRHPPPATLTTSRAHLSVVTLALTLALTLNRCDTFTLLWRNAAAPHGHDRGGEDKASDGDGEAAEPCAADGRACYAVLAPSMCGLRARTLSLGPSPRPRPRPYPPLLPYPRPILSRTPAPEITLPPETTQERAADGAQGARRAV